jgi:aryl-alcohol dehydrogenase-like predicted oxidoreductase
MGGPGWRYAGSAERDHISVGALLHAIDGGVNWVDTAPTYGRGHSEELVGRAVRQAGQRPMVFTNLQVHWPEAPEPTPPAAPEGGRDHPTGTTRCANGAPLASPPICDPNYLRCLSRGVP